jgi:hypothetical protein
MNYESYANVSFFKSYFCSLNGFNKYDANIFLNSKSSFENKLIDSISYYGDDLSNLLPIILTQFSENSFMFSVNVYLFFDISDFIAFTSLYAYTTTSYSLDLSLSDTESLNLST